MQLYAAETCIHRYSCALCALLRQDEVDKLLLVIHVMHQRGSKVSFMNKLHLKIETLAVSGKTLRDPQ